jgi:hypothetical protein
MTVAFDGVRITDADEEEPASPVAGVWEDINGAAANLETDIFYQGTYSISELVKTTELGICFVPDATTYNVTGNDYIFILKGVVTTVGLLQTTRAAGQKFEIGSDASSGSGQPSNYHQWYTYYKSTYPSIGGWVFHAFDIQEAGFIDNTAGTVDGSAINYWGHVATMTSSSVKSQNVAMDAIDYVVEGYGLTWTGSGGQFQDFVDFDEGTTNNRYGIVATRSGVLFVLATLTIGSSTATTFSDSNQKVVFPWTYVGEGALGVKIDLQNASTDVDISVCSFTGNGQSAVKKFFDTTSLQVNAASDYITLTDHEFSTGDYITYSRENGSDDIGPEPGNYWVYVISKNTFALHASRTSAFGDTSRVDLAAATAPGENHSIIRDPDNRIDFTVLDTSGTCDLESCILEGIRVLTLTSACTISSGFIQNTGNVDASTASLDGVAISDATLEEGDALFDPLTSMNGMILMQIHLQIIGTRKLMEATKGGSFIHRMMLIRMLM